MVPPADWFNARWCWTRHGRCLAPLAWSDEGLTWHRDGERPVITQASFSVRRNAWDAALVVRDGELHYYLEIGFGGGTDPSTDVYLATAPIG